MLILILEKVGFSEKNKNNPELMSAYKLPDLS